LAAKAKELLRSDSQSRRLITRVLKENGVKYLPRYLLAFGIMAVVSGLTGASAWILKSVVNDVFVQKNTGLIWAVSLAVFVIYSGRGLADYAQTVLMSRINRDITTSQQKRIYNHLMSQDMRFFNTAALGEIMMYFSQGASGVAGLLSLLLTSLGKDALSLISLGTVMVVMDPVLSLFAFIVTPGALFGIRSIKARIRNIGGNEQAGLIQIIGRLKDSMLGIRVVKSFGLEDRMLGDMNKMIDTVARQGMKISNLSARSGPIMESLVGLALAAAIMYAGFGVAGGGRDAGSLLAFLAALLMTYAPAKSLAKLSLSIEMQLIGVGMMYTFLDKTPRLQDSPDARPLVAKTGSVELRGVTFSYGAQPALADMSVHFPAGKVSAMVGTSGAGKSTIFALIERFYDPDKGEVLIDGQDIRGFTTRSVRAHMALVTQESFLFEGTIRDNILSGHSDATEDEIIAAAEAAHAHEFIMEHPHGYKRIVGEGGGNLSGGQRQRIAIARAMLRNAPILLLDEATSALDAVSEAKVRDALDKLMKGRTTIVIAHRLSTVRKADIIHVIEGGRLVESGTHDSLVALKGTYANLSALQLSGDSDEKLNTLVPAAE
jgi:subfamily B ATP-binding cassette protein MsbA